MSSEYRALNCSQRDFLTALGRINGPDVSGQDIKREAERLRGSEVTHGALYPNLRALVDAGLVDRGELNRRTNWYALTEDGRRVLKQVATVQREAAGYLALADGGRENTTEEGR
ncbi:PadR family transcriptional regulator [Halomarina oriensis]|uniref:PadR family transcriptional regulator n=1 Tax=Halomarina oriensis TaxID=671145 RepID=A0A6B0GMQ3_9EURY|nr:helix-turn-helix transcriptional regulator [Halomarina oriensis]MWG36196.1 PadR family transcriptional regulator [Halomarina oriensis]